MSKRDVDHFLGCVIGGAIGDSLGAPVEFWSYENIVRVYGCANSAPQIASEIPILKFTDDTQMTLFTIEGLINSMKFGGGGSNIDPTPFIHDSYLDWLFTQEGSFDMIPDRTMPGESTLLKIRELHEQRAPGATCLTALESQIRGRVDDPINDSKGCGGVMRVAPIGLCYQPKRAYRVACEAAAITHGHPSGYLSAGVLAAIVSNVVEGKDLISSIEDAIEFLPIDVRGDETRFMVEQAIELSRHDISSDEAIEILGEGWVAEEALAISVYCSLRSQVDLIRALSMAICHKGDSDSTGAITGNILGAYYGMQALPKDWVEKLEISTQVSAITKQLFEAYS